MEINLKDYSIVRPTISPITKGNIISFGTNNNFPNECLELINNSPIQSAIINNKILYTIGSGLEEWEQNIPQPNSEYNWDILVKRCIEDYVKLGAFALQLVKKGRLLFIFHQPVNAVRFGKLNSLNKPTEYYINADWSKGSKNRIQLKAFDGIANMVNGETYLAYFKEYKMGELFYAIPNWYSVANWINCDIELSKYYSNFIHNNFSANLAITYPTDVANKEELYENITNTFTGTNNSARVMLLFGENGEKPTIENITSTNADLYNSVTEIVTQYIVSGNGLPSKTLAGLQDKTGFTSQSEQLISAYSLYKLTIIQPIRNFVLGVLNDLLSSNGYDRVLNILDLNLRDEIEGDSDKNTEIVKETGEIENE